MRHAAKRHVKTAEGAFGQRDKHVVEARAARADILLEAADYQNALNAYTQLRPDAVADPGALQAHVHGRLAHRV